MLAYLLYREPLESKNAGMGSVSTVAIIIAVVVVAVVVVACFVHRFDVLRIITNRKASSKVRLDNPEDPKEESPFLDVSSKHVNNNQRGWANRMMNDDNMTIQGSAAVGTDNDKGNEEDEEEIKEEIQEENTEEIKEENQEEIKEENQEEIKEENQEEIDEHNREAAAVEDESMEGAVPDEPMFDDQEYENMEMVHMECAKAVDGQRIEEKKEGNKENEDREIVLTMEGAMAVDPMVYGHIIEEGEEENEEQDGGDEMGVDDERKKEKKKSMKRRSRKLSTSSLGA